MGVDANDNRVSDVYEALYPLTAGVHGDDDGDGMSNENEAAAGTNPKSGGAFLNFTTVTNNGGTVTGGFSSVSGKTYQMQSQSTLGGTWADEGGLLQGTGGAMTAQAPSTGGRMFVRLAVSDQDSDADGANDWEELQAGTNRYMWDTDGDGQSDAANIAGRLATGNQVSVVAAQAKGSEAGPLAVVFRITRHGGILPVTVNYTLGGTAVGADYTASAAGSVTFASGQATALVSLIPLSDGTVEPQESVVMTLTPSANYTLSGMSVATGSIDDNRLGLTGQYFNSQETTYPTPPATNLNFNPANLNTTRIDPVVDFSFGGGAPAGTTITAVDSYGARWSGSLLPATTGSYLFHVQLDRGAVLYVNGVALISQWSAAQDIAVAAPEFTSAAVTLTAGQPVSIQLDFRESGTTNTRAEVHLSWTPPGGAKGIIPNSALRADTAPPVITSGNVAIALLGAPFSHTVTAPGATAFAAANLPAGLTINPTTGLISGTPGGTAGLKFVTVTAGNVGGTASQELTILVISTGGSITREVWTTGLTGSGVLSVPVHTTPSATSTVTSLAAPADDGDNYGERMRGYITAPATGLYTFFVTSDENAEVWVSSSEEPASKLKRAWVTAGSVGSGVWDAVLSQKSITMSMAAGARYYIEVIRREGPGSDHLQVGWLRPGQTGTVPSEVIPGWALTSYSAPPATSDGGFLYAAVLTPQSGASTLGTGSALLRVNAAKTDAELTLTFGNLTGPITNSHIHDSRSQSTGVPPHPLPAGAIVFDVDDADPDLSDGLDPSEVYHWDIVATGQHTYDDVIAAIEGGTAYLNLHTAAYPNGEIKGFFAPVIGSQFFTPPAAPPAAELTLPADATARKNEIVRFLQQATFGGRHEPDGTAPYAPDTIEAVSDLGYAAWVDTQLALPAGTDPEMLVTQTLPPRTVYFYTPPTPASRTLRFTGTNTGYNGSGPLGTFVKNWYDKWPLVSYSNVGSPLETSDDLWRAWWRTTITAQDQLRHRVAFALSQIIITSEDGELDEQTRGLAHYYDLLYYHGLGNFRTLLEKTTLNPSMGRYLDMLNNRKPDPTRNYIPNENFAREIMQLFSIGLRRLHPDGTLVLSSGGLPVNSYEQPNVVGLAHVFTGWIQPGNGNNYIAPMIPQASQHDIGQKLLLENTVIPATATATTASCNAEFAAALDVIFHHPNTGPFVCRQLIQRMVTANPSPGYIYRVARVFADNGNGVRGDMAAVVKTILLDPEARNQAPRAQTGFGHLKEPVVRATQMLRAFNGFSYGEANYGSVNMLTTVMISPNTNVDLTLPLPGEDYAGSSSGGTALFAGDLIRLNGQTVTAENGYYTFAGIGQPLTAAATGTAVTTYTTNISLLTGPPVVHVPLVENISVGMNNLILLRVQTNPAENGVYVLPATNMPLVRWSGADTEAELSNAVVRVGVYRDPTTLAYGSNKTYKVDGPIATLGTSPVNFIDASATSSGAQMWNMGTTGGSSLSQTPMRAPTVFNYYEPDYVFLGDTGVSGLYSPEFQITSETTVVNVANWFHELTRQNTGAVMPHTYGQGYSYGGTIGRDIKLDMAAQEAVAGDTTALLDSVAAMVMPGQLTPRLRTLLSNYLSGLPLSGTTVLLPAASTWKYFTDSAGLGASNIVAGNGGYSATNWKHPDFVDASWTSGAAPLGYRTNTTPANLNITTVIPFGASSTNKWVSSYYRSEFTIASASSVPGVTIRLKRDDGAIVYINGVEAWRQNFNAGVVVSGTTVATGAGDDGAAFFTTTIPNTYLANGRNVVAVEVHQNSVGSSDIVFDLELNHPSVSATDRMNRVSEALSILSLCPEFTTQK